jgi:hypothetical protein
MLLPFASVAAVMFPNQRGEIEMNALFIGSDSAFYEWGSDLFDYYWSQAGYFDIRKATVAWLDLLNLKISRTICPAYKMYEAKTIFTPVSLLTPVQNNHSTLVSLHLDARHLVVLLFLSVWI